MTVSDRRASRRLLQRLRARAARWRTRERLQDVGYGLLMAALAISIPMEAGDLAGKEVVDRLAGDQTQITQGLLYPFARGAMEVFGVESPALLMRILAGLAYAGALVLTLGFLRGLGFRRSAAVPASFAAFVVPYAWQGATAPIDYAFGLLGASVVLWSLLRYEQSSHRGYHWRAILAGGLAYMLSVDLVLLVPAIAIAVARHPEYRREASMNFMAVLVVLLMSIAISLSGSQDGLKMQHLSERTLAGADGFSLASARGWLVELPRGFGVVLFGVYQLLFAARGLETKRAPFWMVPWCLVVAAPIVSGTIDHAPIAPYLVPAGALGIADWLNRRGHARREQVLGLALLAIQITATALILV